MEHLATIIIVIIILILVVLAIRKIVKVKKIGQRLVRQQLRRLSLQLKL